MDILEATEDHVMHAVGGKEYRFDFLNGYEKADLLRADLIARQTAHAAKKQLMLENFKLAELESKETKYGELQRHDEDYPDQVTEDDWVRMCKSPVDLLTIYERSLKAVADDAERKRIAGSVVMPLAKLVKIVGLAIVTPEEAQTNPNAGAPAVYGTPAQNLTSDLPAQNSGTSTASPTPSY